jgi:hypothetical protein
LFLSYVYISHGSLFLEEPDVLPREAGELTVKPRKLEFDSPSTARPSSSSEPTVYLEDMSVLTSLCCFNLSLLTTMFFFSAPTVVKPSFAIIPFDDANGPASCPAHLLHMGEDGSVSPVELVEGAFDLFEDAAYKSVYLCFCLFACYLLLL